MNTRNHMPDTHASQVKLDEIPDRPTILREAVDDTAAKAPADETSDVNGTAAKATSDANSVLRARLQAVRPDEGMIDLAEHMRRIMEGDSNAAYTRVVLTGEDAKAFDERRKNLPPPTEFVLKLADEYWKRVKNVN